MNETMFKCFILFYRIPLFYRITIIILLILCVLLIFQLVVGIYDCFFCKKSMLKISYDTKLNSNIKILVDREWKEYKTGSRYIFGIKNLGKTTITNVTVTMVSSNPSLVDSPMKLDYVAHLNTDITPETRTYHANIKPGETAFFSLICPDKFLDNRNKITLNVTGDNTVPNSNEISL